MIFSSGLFERSPTKPPQNRVHTHAKQGTPDRWTKPAANARLILLELLKTAILIAASLKN
jgi:hypothetical protein